MNLLPISQYYQCQCQCQYRYQCQYNIGQSNRFYRCADVKNMADTDINIGASLVIENCEVLTCRPGYSNPLSKAFFTCFTTSAPAFLASCCYNQ